MNYKYIPFMIPVQSDYEVTSEHYKGFKHLVMKNMN